MLIESFEKEVDSLAGELREQYLSEADMTDEGCCFRLRLAEFVTSYSRLLILSHGLQQSFENGSPPDPVILTNALRTATTAINSFVNNIASTGFWRYSPDCYIIYSGYCSTFLLKLIDAKFPHPFDDVQKERIIELVSGLVDTLSSPEIAIDESHTPKLYAGFLAGLLKRVGKEVRESKRLRLDQEREARLEMEQNVSPPPSSQDSAVTSPQPHISDDGSVVGTNGVQHEIDYSDSQNSTLTAFPNVTTGGEHIAGNESNFGYSNVVDVTAYPNTNWGSTLDPNTGMSWEDVYATPDSLNAQAQMQIHTGVGFAHLAPSEHSGHPMALGTQWNFITDEKHPYEKWGMEDLCPTVHNLMPTVHQFCE